VKVKRILVKRVGVVSSQHSDAVSLREHMVGVSICESRTERMRPSRQSRSNDEVSRAITFACRRKRRGEGELRIDDRKAATK
jgi:hypothetical protein